jgi:triacylglycerol lipase
MTEANERLAPLDAAKAVGLGLIVDACYDMHDKNPGDLRPPLPDTITADYFLVGWVQMRDFFIGEGPYVFYGLLLKLKSDPTQAVLAIRGTVGFDEWYADFRSIVPKDWTGPGQVGDGFDRIYQTMRIVKPTDPSVQEESTSRALTDAGPFEAQVAAAVGHHANRNASAEVEAQAPSPTLDVVGHSLGSALATLYVAKNAHANLLGTPLLCTFASPLVGNATFANWFDGLSVTSWRIVNDLDIVTKVPAIGFQHVARLYEYNSGFDTVPTPGCFHSLDTYLHLLDASRLVASGCRWPILTAARREGMTAAVPVAKEVELEVPNRTGTTINISIKIGS